MRILVVGAGAVGSYISGWLYHEGHEVTVLDPWSEHVAAVNERGLSVSGPHEPFTASLDMLNIHEAQRLARRPAFDIGFICVKSFDTSWAATLAARFIGNGRVPRFGPKLLERSHGRRNRRCRSGGRAGDVVNSGGPLGARYRCAGWQSTPPRLRLRRVSGG